MKYIVFDTETSGLFDGENTILSLSYQVVESTTWKKIKERNYFFAWPQDESRVSQEAITINGLTKEFLSKQELANPKDALTEFIADVKNSELVVAHNLDFDKRFVKSACMEYGVDFCGDAWANTYDTMIEMTDYCNLKKEYGSGNKWPKLKELAQALYIDCSDIDFHKSSADVEITQRCFKEIIRQGLFIFDEDDRTITAKLKVHSATDVKILYFQGGRMISDDYISAKQKAEIKKILYAKWALGNQEETDDIVRGYKYAPIVKSESDFQIEKDQIACLIYEREKCQLKPLSKEKIEEQLRIEAEEKFKSIFFWKNKHAREEYVANNCEARYEAMMSDYNKHLTLFEKEQDEKENSFNAQARLDYQDKITQYQKRINGDKDLLLEEFRRLPDHMCHRIETEVVPTIQEGSNVIDLGIRLPSIDTMPRLTSVRLANGTYKIKELRDAEVKDYYAECVTGLGFFFAAYGFNISPCIKKINIRGFLPTFDAIGKCVENTIYTLTLTREQMMDIDFRHLSPVKALTYYPYSYNMPKDLRPTPLVKCDICSDDAINPSAEDTHRLDPMFADVARYVVSKQEGSTSRLQRAFEIGYNRAGKLSDQLEATGIVGPNKGPKGRDVLIQDLESLEKILQQLGV